MAIADWDAFLRRVMDRVASPAHASGYFDRVQTFEPKSAPGHGLTYAVFVESLSPIAAASGLAVTSARLIVVGRIYKPFLAIPEDLIDPNMAGATGFLINAYSGDFELGGEVRNIDLLGAHGQALEAKAGYQSVDKTTFRIMDITIPMIINDAWDQVG